MTSPAKKRRKNDYAPSDQPVRGLEYFFAKQQQQAVRTLSNAPQERTPAEAESSAIELRDEELARRLQAQWNQEDGQTAAKLESETAQSTRPLESAAFIGEGQESKDESKAPEPAESKRHRNTLALQSAASEEDTVTTCIPFDESPLTFDPSNYIPDLKRHWASDGGIATYALLTRCFVLINSTSSRIKIVDTLVNLLRTLIESDPDSLLPAVSPLSPGFWTLDAHRLSRFGWRPMPSHLPTSTLSSDWVARPSLKPSKTCAV
jgi:DNA ligase 1